MRTLGALLVAVLFTLSANPQETSPPAPQLQFQPQDPDIRALQQQLQQMLGERLKEGIKSPPAANEKVRETKGFRGLDPQAQALVEQLRDRLLARLQAVIQQNLGPMQALGWETVPLEAVDRKGRSIEIPMSVQVRPLRRLTDLGNPMKTNYVVGEDNLAFSLYDTLPRVVDPEETRIFERAYTGEDARAVETEAKLLVSLKGGEWNEPNGKGPVANAIAVRGLDLDEGLKPNGNTTYDDTLYLVIDQPGKDVEAYEYRMTTESSSAQRGVGRLDSKQVWYVRGLHRGKDPAYKLKGSVAEGTRAGEEGTYQISGANIHSAYSRRTIDSETPLRPNVSLGCQVIAAGKSDFEKSMVRMLDTKGVKEFPYTIVDGEELSVLDSALAQHQKQSILIHGVPRREVASR